MLRWRVVVIDVCIRLGGRRENIRRLGKGSERGRDLGVRLCDEGSELEMGRELCCGRSVFLSLRF
jgi:hypothetical protein